MSKATAAFLCSFLFILSLTVQVKGAQEGNIRISAEYPRTESYEVNQEINRHVQREIDYFKNLVNWAELEMGYVPRAFNRHIVSFTIETTARGADGQPIFSRSSGLAFDLLSGRRLTLGHVIEGGIFGYSEDFDSFAFDAENLHLYVDGSSMIIPVAQFGGFRAALNYEAGFNGGGFASEDADYLSQFVFAGDMDDAHFPIDASMPPGWRRMDVVLDMQRAALTNNKYVALTFDDGPCRSVTTRILDALAKHDARATFFVLGHKIPIMPDLIQRMHYEGHRIGNHSYNHRQFTAISKSALEFQILETNRLIQEITNSPVTLLRPPYGAHDTRTANIARDLDMSIITWDIDPRDWVNFNPQSVADHIIERAQDGSIILLHDVYESTADAAIIVLETLSARGFVFVTVDELINMHAGLVPGLVYRTGKAVGR